MATQEQKPFSLWDKIFISLIIAGTAIVIVFYVFILPIRDIFKDEQVRRQTQRYEYRIRVQNRYIRQLQNELAEERAK